MTFISNLSPWPPLLPAPPYAINWGLKPVSGPAVEPVTVTMLKNHARIELYTDDWTVLPRFIRAATRQLQHDTNRFFVTQTVDLFLDQFPLRAIPLLVPRPPLQSIVSVTTYDTSSVPTVDTTLSNYIVDTASEPGRIGVIDNALWPQNLRAFMPIVIRFIAGYTGMNRGGGITTLAQTDGDATATTSAAHGLGVGEYATIAGVSNDAGYNGTFMVTAVDNDTQFHYKVPTATASPATTTTAITVSDLGVPDEALEAVMLLAAHFYENREASIVSDRRITVQDMPIGYDDLVWSLKVPYVN